MGLWEFARDERVILATIGVATFSIVTMLIATLTMIRDENEVKVSHPKAQYITQDTEDSLQIETLDKLMDHPTFSIRDIAMRILCDRAVNDPDVMAELIDGIRQRDYEHRMKCLRALALLSSQANEGLTILHSVKGYTAIVDSLEVSLSDDNVDRPKLNDNHWDEYYLRDMSEKFCLLFLFELASKHGAEHLVRASFVEKWLAKQNWGDGEEERQKNFRNYVTNPNRQNRIVDIIKLLQESKPGLKALVKNKLITEDDEKSGGILDDVYFEISMGAGEANVEQQGPRNHQHSAEEQRLRRQHREAMVFNDGTRPIGRQDIIERGRDSPS